MLIKVKVFPNSNKQEILKKSEDSFEVKVKAEAKRGEANRETLEVLADYFNLPESRVRLIRGFKMRNKIFNIKK